SAGAPDSLCRAPWRRARRVLIPRMRRPSLPIRRRSGEWASSLPKEEKERRKPRALLLSPTTWERRGPFAFGRMGSEGSALDHVMRVGADLAFGETVAPPGDRGADAGLQIHLGRPAGGGAERARVGDERAHLRVLGAEARLLLVHGLVGAGGGAHQLDH